MTQGLGFDRYVAKRKRAVYGGEAGARYAYSADVAMLNAFRRMKPVELAAAATVRAYKEVLKNQLLGTTVKITPRQFPSIYKITEECAEALGVPVPTVYVANDPRLNAYTFGTDDDAFIVIHAALVDHYEADELKFVIGHETGHIQNKHVVYATLLVLFQNTLGLLVQWLLPPVQVALHAWYRRAEVTCDRAGLLCCKDDTVAARALLKLACGSKKLYQELDVNEYMKQMEEGRDGVGRMSELFASHPYLPKRIAAMRVFSESAMYREAAGVGEGGLSIEEVDARTSELIQVVNGKPKGETKAKSEEGPSGD